MNIAQEEEEGKTTPHGTETIGWLAIEPGVGEWSGHFFETALTADAVTHSWYSFSFGQSFSAAPRFLAGLASYDSDESAHLRYRRAQLTAAGAQVRAEEDSVFDSEYGHTTETAAYLAIEGDGELSATGGISGPASTTYYKTQGGAPAMRRAGYPTDNGIFYILSDHLGSSSVILAQDGTVLKRDYYHPYGGNRGTPYTDITTKRFTGQYHEAGLPGGEGLSFYNARWYDPQLGRFVSADSVVPELRSPQDFNRYGYARGNPVRFSDPTGHVCYNPDMDAAFPGNCGGGSTPIAGSKTSQSSQPTNVVSRLVPASPYLQKFLNYMGINQKAFGIKVHSNASPTNPNLNRYEIGAWVLIQEQASFHPLSYPQDRTNQDYFSVRGLYLSTVLLQVIQSKEEHYVQGGVDLFNWIQENPQSGQFAYPLTEIPYNQRIYDDYLIVAFLVDQKILPDFLASYSSQPTRNVSSTLRQLVDGE